MVHLHDEELTADFAFEALRSQPGNEGAVDVDKHVKHAVSRQKYRNVAMLSYTAVKQHAPVNARRALKERSNKQLRWVRSHVGY